MNEVLFYDDKKIKMHIELYLDWCFLQWLNLCCPDYICDVEMYSSYTIFFVQLQLIWALLIPSEYFFPVIYILHFHISSAIFPTFDFLNTVHLSACLLNVVLSINFAK